MFKRILAAALSAAMITSMGGVSPRAAAADGSLTKMWNDFSKVPEQNKPRPLWFWNNALRGITKEGIREIMVNSKQQSGYFGFAILPEWIDKYLSDEYMELYRYALETAKELGMTMILYDENGWPSGQAGGLLNAEHPEATVKRLDKTEIEVKGPAKGILNIPQGTYRKYAGAVAMNMDTNEIIDISDTIVYTGTDASGVFGSSAHDAVGSETFTADKAFDGDLSTRWNAGVGTGSHEWLQVNFAEPTTLDRMEIYEALGRITRFTIEYEQDGEWKACASGEKIGDKKEVTFDPVTAKTFRFVVNESYGPDSSLPSIYEIKMYSGQTEIPAPKNAVDQVSDHISYDLPQGNWRVMSFATVRSTDNIVDYLTPESVKKYMDITFERYYELFPEYFGTVIDTVFYDEPSLHYASGRTWAPEFNEKFEAEYGYNPITLYPALWYDIGEDTASARTTLHDFRAKLYQESYIKQMNDWCTAHKLKLTGHQVQEEPINQTPITGDAMAVFKHQEIPGVDDIGYVGAARRIFKVVTSAANNYDHLQVMTEAYGAMTENLSVTDMYRDIMDQYTRGVNFIIPHAVWYNNSPREVTHPPELSYRSKKFGPALPAFNEYTGRSQSILQNSRHVSDIAVMYPVDSLQSEHKFDAGSPWDGGNPPEAGDYQDVGERIFSEAKHDYTFLHPDVLADNCTVSGSEIHLNNRDNYEDYKVVVMPAQKTMSLAALKKIKEFYDNGGKVIATTMLPIHAAEKGKDAELIAILEEMFGVTKAEFNAKSNAKYSASSVYSGGYTADKAFDGIASETSRWNAADKTSGGEWLEVDFGAPKEVNRTVISENPYRVSKYRIQYWDNGSWKDCVSGTTLGESKEDRFETVTTEKLRLYIDAAESCVSIREFEVYKDNSANLATVTPKKYTAENANGGKAVFLSGSYEDNLVETVNSSLSTHDVTVGGQLSYIHKVKDGRDVYFFANASGKNLSADITLRGEYRNLYIWNPHDGTRVKADSKAENGVTTLNLSLGAAKSAFLIDEKNDQITHNFSPEWTVDKPASCTQGGLKSHHCTDCGEISDQTEIPPIGHQYDDGVVTTPPTATADGVLTKTCAVCGDTITRPIPKKPVVHPPKPEKTPDGVKTEDGKKVVYKNGERVTGAAVVTIGKKTYAVKKGYLYTGKARLYTIGKKTYLIDKAGVVQKSAKTKYKLLKLKNTRYIADRRGVIQKSGKAKYKLFAVGKKNYAVNRKGAVQVKKARLKVGKKLYRISAKGAAVKIKKK